LRFVLYVAHTHTHTHTHKNASFEWQSIEKDNFSSKGQRFSGSETLLFELTIKNYYRMEKFDAVYK